MYICHIERSQSSTKTTEKHVLQEQRRIRKQHNDGQVSLSLNISNDSIVNKDILPVAVCF